MGRDYAREYRAAAQRAKRHGFASPAQQRHAPRILRPADDFVGLVVEDDDVLLRAERATDPANHLVGGLLELVSVSLGAGEDLLRERGGPFECPSIAPNEAMEVCDLDLGRLKRLELIRREEIALLVVVAGQVRPKDLQSVPDRDARVTTRKASENRLSWALASLLSACQAMSMAMTTVFPEPVAILKAIR